ncbi:exported protein of unknown function [Methylococcus capsulatus]|uniref:Lipoprotein n=1 Tax=Methylococcus capsulatus TaxID=414 RepID=A0AA35V218_METCP|nr:exported protein of unknown function [Methylococcus capsulatus]
MSRGMHVRRRIAFLAAVVALAVSSPAESVRVPPWPAGRGGTNRAACPVSGRAGPYRGIVRAPCRAVHARQSAVIRSARGPS